MLPRSGRDLRQRLFSEPPGQVCGRKWATETRRLADHKGVK